MICGVFAAYLLNLFLQTKNTMLQTYTNPAQIADDALRSYQLTLRAAKFFLKDDFNSAIEYTANLPAVLTKQCVFLRETQCKNVQKSYQQLQK